MVTVLYILSIVTIVYTVTNKSLFRPMREYVTKKRMDNKLWKFLFKVLTCEFCLSVYVAPIMYYFVFVLGLEWITYILSLPIISLFLTKLTTKIDY